MKNKRNANQPASGDLVQTYLRSSWDIVKAIYDALPLLTSLGEAIQAGDLDDFLSPEDIDTINELNAILTDATLGDFSSQAQAEAGLDNTTTMTPLRVSQAIATGAGGLQHNYTGTTPPDANDDSSAGYSAGSYWFDTTADPDETYRCTDPGVAAAVWIKTSLTTDELATVAVSGDSDDLIEGSVQLLLSVAERATIAAIDEVFTTAEKDKLTNIEIAATADQTDSEIETAYNSQVGQVSAGEKTAGTEVAVRRFSPDDVKDMIGIHETADGNFLPLAGGQMAGDIEGDTGIELGTAANPFWNLHSLNAYLTSFFYLGASSNRMTITANKVSSGKNSSFDFSIDNKTADEATEYFLIQGQKAYANAGTNIVGGEVRIRGGQGALNAGGDAHGGDLTLDGGLPEGTGTEGDVEICQSYGKAKIHSELLLVEKAVGSLPAAATFAGYMSGINDALAPVNGSTVSAGGAVSCVVYSDGTNWIVVTGGTTASGGDVATDDIWDAAGDLAVGSGSNTAARLAKGNALDVLRVNAGGTNLEFAAPAAGGGGGLTPVFKTASFTAVAGEKYFVDSSGGAVVVTLPAGVDDDNIKILDVGHAAGTNNITINPDGAETIDNDTEFVIDQNEGDVDIAFNGTNWEVSSDGTPTVINVPIAGPVKVRTVRTVIEKIINSIADEFDFNNIPSGYDRLIIKGTMRSDGSGVDDTFEIFLNEDLTPGNYHSQHDHSANGIDYSTEAPTSAIIFGGGDSSPATAHSAVTIEIENPDSSNNKLILSAYGSEQTVNNLRCGNATVTSIITAAIVRIRLRTDNDPTDQFTGTLTLYGEKDEEIGGGNQFEEINAQTGTTYEFTVNDFVDGVTAENASASTYDVPDTLGRPGNVITLLNKGAGEVTITVAGSDTLGSSDNKCATGKAVSIMKTDTTEWWVIGGSA